MATISFGTAILVFVSIWLIALIAFGTATAAIFLYILNGVTAAIGASTAMSLVCSFFTITYLVIQSVNVAHINRTCWHGSWLSPLCVQLPRVLMASWVPTTAVGLWSTLRQPACESGTAVADATAWQNGLSCWVFRVMVSLTVVMLVLVVSNLIILEINGRHVPIGLFHFEYAVPERGFQHTRRYCRTTLGEPIYGGSVESLASPRTITSEEELQMTSSAEKLQTRNAYHVSPSPTYRTLDLSIARSRTPALPDTMPPCQEEESFIDLPMSRNSTCTTLILSSFPATPTSAAPHASVFASSQLAARPLSVSGLPAIPTSFQRQVQELEAIKHTSMNHATKPVRPALCNITNANVKIRSSSAIPLASANKHDSAFCDRDIVVGKIRSTSLTEIIEKPPPAWCSSTKLKSMPLSSDPAIKKLTDLRRNSKLGIGFDRMSRRISLSGFEFGFSGSTRVTKAKSKIIDEEIGEQRWDNQRTDGETMTEDKEALPSATEITNKAGQIPVGELSPSKKTIERKHPIRGTAPGHPKRPGISLSIMPPPVPDRAIGHVRGQSAAGQGRKRGKSVVERGRYEKLSR